MNWGSEDFLAAGLLLGGALLAVFVVLRVLKRPAARVAASVLVVGVAALVWAELAVGIFR